MSAKFTPLPWTAVHGDKDSRIAANTLLAIVYSTAYRDAANQQANANLIAATPDMFQALTVAREFVAEELACREASMTPPSGDDAVYITAARSTLKLIVDAIAKAEGAQ